MIDVGIFSLIGFVGIVMLASAAGFYLSSALPWSEAARNAGLPSAAGLAIGPFLAGLGAVLSLGLLRGAAHGTHLAAVVGIIVVVGVSGFAMRRRRNLTWPLPPLTASNFMIIVTIAVSLLALLYLVMFFPLSQNDALEYAIVAREIYATGDLLTYPVLNPEANLSGFYGPWTHPPLYVSLLYLANVMQGAAREPALLRLIAPWCLMCGAGVVYALASLIGRTTGLLACLIFISPPLIFLGAGQALLDPLPILGFALIIAVVVGIHAQPAVYGAIVGLSLGLALWTHSQAILFVPLTLVAVGVMHGLRDVRGLATAWLCLIGVAVVIAAWPYWRNTQIFGAPISDNPLVFALPSLHWTDYFTIARGLNTPTAMIQYGILKGWFVLESYGFIFWGMAVGAVVVVMHQSFSQVRKVVLEGARAVEPPDALGLVLTALAGVYLGGVVLSVCLGIDHMVKNERYLLVTLPIVAILCAYAIMAVARAIQRRFPNAEPPLVAAACLFLSLQIVSYVSFMSSKQRGSLSISSSLQEKLATIPDYALISSLNSLTGPDALVLSMKPADMFYANARMISYLDPRLLNFYREPDTRKARDMLAALGVTHVHVPDYGLPPFYNSQLFAIVGDPNLTTLLAQEGSGAVYALSGTRAKAHKPIALDPSVIPWRLKRYFAFGGRKGFAKAEQPTGTTTGQYFTSGLPLGLMHRHWTTNVAIGVDAADDLPRRGQSVSVHPATLYQFELSLEGRGYVKVIVNQYETDVQGAFKASKSQQISTFELSDEQQRRSLKFQLMTAIEAKAVSLSFELMGTSWLSVNQVRLTEFSGLMHQPR